MSTHTAAPDDMDVSSGELLAQLLLETRWVHRRVESLRMDANGGTRLLASLDITLPDPGIPRGSDRVLIPFALVQKGALRKVDTFDHAGRPMPVLDTNDNGRLVVEMLVALGRSVLPERVTTSKRYEAALQDVVYCALDDAWKQVARFRGWLSAFGIDSDAPPARGVHLFGGAVQQSLLTGGRSRAAVRRQARGREVLVRGPPSGFADAGACP